MGTLTADAALLAKLREVKGLTEIRDPDGNIVGVFAPAGAERAPEYMPQAGEVDWEELKRRAQSTEGRTLKEIFRRMQSLTTDESVRARLQQKIDRMTEEEGCVTP